MATASRRQRRGEFKQAGFLKIKNMFGRFSEQGIAWHNKMAEDGRAMEAANEKRRLDSIEEQLEEQDQFWSDEKIKALDKSISRIAKGQP